MNPQVRPLGSITDDCSAVYFQRKEVTMNVVTQEKKRTEISRLWLLLLLVFLFIPHTAQAEEASLNFYVTPEFPTSQVADSNSYFDLNLAPGQTETLTLTLQNATDDPRTIQVTPHTAYTNVMGVVEYGKDADKPDPTLPYSLADQIETPEPIVLAGKETKTVEIALYMPKEAFEGFLAGGLRISEVADEQDVPDPAGEGVAIKNEYAYVLGVVVSNSRDSVKPDLDLLDVFADQLNYRNVISATIQNFTPTFVNRLSVEASVHRKGENDVLYEAHEEQMQMAPNSHFNFPISLNGDRFRSGDYVLNLTARSGEEEWHWTEEFTIKADEARSLNQEDVTIDSSLNWWMIGSIGLTLLLVGLLLYLIFHKKQVNENAQKTKE